MSKKRIVTDPQNADADSSAILILDNLAAGRTPEELIAHNPNLSLDIIEATKKRVLEVAIYDEDRSFFRSSLRIRHLVVALQPHPIANIICDAFVEVRLGNGPSLRQMYVMDNWGEDDSGQLLSHQEFKQISQQDEVDSWEAVKLVDIDVYRYFAYCDAESFRFYIPARMIYGLAVTWQELIDDLYPNESFQGKREYCLSKYALLDDRQGCSIACFLLHVMEDSEYDEVNNEIQTALKGFWLQYFKQYRNELLKST